MEHDPATPARELEAIAVRLREEGQEALPQPVRVPMLRRADDPVHGDARLRIYALGSTELDAPAGRVTGGWLAQRPGRLLKFLLCVNGRTATHDQIAEALWPGAGASGPAMVRQVVYRLRERLSDLGPWDEGEVITTLRSSYALNSHVVWLDADALETSVRAAAARYFSGDRDRVEHLFRHAVSLYRGDFMAEEAYTDWAIWERERLRGLTEQALRALVELRLLAGDVAGAAAHQERLAELLPFDPDVHRRLVELLLQIGRRSEALRRFGLFRMMLVREFGEQPDFSLSDLLHGVEQRQSG